MLVLLYIQSLSPLISSIFRKHETPLIYKNCNKLKFSSFGKDPLNKLETINTVYKVDCADTGCNATYIGQSSCKLKKRISEHKGDVRHNRTTSALALHSINTSHKFDFDDLKILDQVSYKKQREFSEMLNIHFFPDTLNRIQKTMFLKNLYKKIVDHIKKFRFYVKLHLLLYPAYLSIPPPYCNYQYFLKLLPVIS